MMKTGIKYGFDWNNDGIVDKWTSLYNSGETASITHTWNNAGTYYVKVKAQDEYGRESEWSNALQITIAPYTPPPPPNQKPNIEITSPLNGSTVSRILRIRGNASDDKGVVKVEIMFDNGTTSWNYTLNTKKLKDGFHKLEVRAFDGHSYGNIFSIKINVKNKKVPGFGFITIIVAIAILIAYIKKRN